MERKGANPTKTEKEWISPKIVRVFSRELEQSIEDKCRVDQCLRGEILYCIDPIALRLRMGTMYFPFRVL